MDIIDHFGWSYISILFSEGVYGENGKNQIEKEIIGKGICVAYAKKISITPDEPEYDLVIEELLENQNARAVILFLESQHATGLFSAVTRSNISQYFIWIGSEPLAYIQPSLASNGLISLDFRVSNHKDFDEYYGSLTPKNATDNPWMRTLWESYYDCDWEGSDRQSCQMFENKPFKNRKVNPWTSKLYDAVWVYAYALDRLIKEKCPEVYKDKSLLPECIQGRQLLPYMKKVSFEGISGEIRFNDDGDYIGPKTILQFSYNSFENSGVKKPVGEWTPGNLKIDTDSMIWNHYTDGPRTNSKVKKKIPYSVCSQPCLARQYKIQKKVACCWSCLYCRDNEIVVERKSCTPCPENTWPDESTATWCENIEPTYMKLTDTMAIILMVLSACCFFALIVIVMIFFKNKEVKLIKASGRELIAIMTCGIALAYLTIYTFVLKPTTLTCHVSHIGRLVFSY